MQEKKWLYINVKLQWNTIIATKTNQQEWSCIPFDLINNFLGYINNEKIKGNKYNDSIILEYVQWRLKKVFGKHISPEQNRFLGATTNKLQKYTPELKDLLDQTIEMNIKNLKQEYKPYEYTKREKLNKHNIPEIINNHSSLPSHIKEEQTNENFDIVNVHQHNVEDIDNIFDKIKELTAQLEHNDSHIISLFNQEINLYITDLWYHSLEENILRLETLEQQFVTLETDKSLKSKRKSKRY